MFKKKINSDTNIKINAEYWYKLAECLYYERQNLIDKNATQTKIDNVGASAAKDFWIALCLGHIKAPFYLYECFGQGIGVKQDNDIASFMFSLAQELKDVRVANKECMFSLPISLKDMVHETAALIKQIEIPKAGINMQHVNEHLEEFNKKMILPDGRNIFKLIEGGNNVFDLNAETILDIIGEHAYHTGF